MTLSVDDLLAKLEATPSWLARAGSSLSDGAARLRGQKGLFSFVENVWHMADLEREGFGARIARLLTEVAPVLPDFDGLLVARERAYQERSLSQGLSAFAEARAENVHRLRQLTPGDWQRAGRQEGVGAVALGDIPRLMLEHDLSHAREISELFIEVAPAHPSLAELAAAARVEL